MRIIFIVLMAVCLMPFGLSASQIDHDRDSASGEDKMISVIINPGNPVQELTTEQLKGIFTGRIKNWAEVGGNDFPIRPLIVRNSSRTRNAFREQVLGSEEYKGCTVIAPDNRIVSTVKKDRSAIGHISLEFIQGNETVKSLSIK
jgi:phosphate transport system substrate-binding protein